MAPGHTADVLLTVTGLTKRFGRVTALDRVSFEVRQGEILGLIGPNGSGKTTLFECVSGVMAADACVLLRGGRPMTAAERSSRLFYLPDAVAPWPSQSVDWALDFAAGFFGGGADPETARDDVVSTLDLSGLLDVAIQALSKGQRKRVLLAVALLMPHPVLLLDEPFDGLDLRQGRDVETLLRDQSRRGRTLFLSIHQISQAARVCDRFVLLNGGRVCAEGTLDHLVTVAAATRPGAGSDLEEVFLALT
jgi:ABC-2 type transport system ATP-binding protein